MNTVYKTVLTAVCATCLSFPAQAAWNTFEGTGFEVCIDADLLPTFDVQGDVVDQYQETWLPGDRLRYHFKGSIVWTNLDSGKQIKERWNSIVLLDFAEGKLYNNGNPVHVMDQGRIMLASGRLVVDLDSGEIDKRVGIDWPQIIAYPDEEGDVWLTLCEALSQ